MVILCELLLTPHCSDIFMVAIMLLYFNSPCVLYMKEVFKLTWNAL